MKKNIRFCFSSLVKTLKETALNSSISDEKFMRSLIEGYIEKGRIKDRNGTPMDFDKTRTSRLMNNKDNLPSAFKSALEIEGIYTDMESTLDYFTEYVLDNKKATQTRKNIIELINNSTNLDSQTKEFLFEKVDTLSALIARALLEAIKIDNKAQQEEIIVWKKGLNQFNVISGDILQYGFSRRKKEKRIVVIPVETTFETHISTCLADEPFPLVSETTLHGKWIIAWKNSGNSIEVLKDVIQKNLQLQGLATERNQYPVGTVAVVEKNNTHFYLSAISRFDEFNTAHSTKEDITNSLTSILKMYDRNGQGYTLYLPLIGTGRSRAQLSNLESWHLIKQTVLKNKKYIQGKICLVVLPDVYIDIYEEMQEEAYV